MGGTRKAATANPRTSRLNLSARAEPKSFGDVWGISKLSRRRPARGQFIDMPFSEQVAARRVGKIARGVR